MEQLFARSLFFWRGSDMQPRRSRPGGMRAFETAEKKSGQSQSEAEFHSNTVALRRARSQIFVISSPLRPLLTLFPAQPMPNDEAS